MATTTPRAREQRAEDRLRDAVSVLVSVSAGYQCWTTVGWVEEKDTAQALFDRALASYRRAIRKAAK